LVAAITVQVIAGGAGVCAAAEAPSAIAPSESDNDSIPVVLNSMMTSQLNGLLKHHTRFLRLL
jgi:hypothetical protein